jgi:hypothetical protein
MKKHNSGRHLAAAVINMRNILLIIAFILFIPVIKTAGQKKFCADSSIRIKYSFNYNTIQLFNRHDTNGTNTFAGVFTRSSNPISGIPVLRTNWGDSIYWAKDFI